MKPSIVLLPKTMALNLWSSMPARILKRKFAIRRNLICRASLQVATTFNGLIGKPGVPEIILCDEDPTTFQAFYDWLYSGQVQEAEQYNGFVPSEIYWLRVYAMATRLEIEVLQTLPLTKFKLRLGKRKLG